MSDNREIMIEEVEKYINSTLRERVQTDGGDMQFVSLSNDEVTICVFADCAVCTHIDCNMSWWINKRLMKKFGKDFKILIKKDVPYYYKIG